MLDFERLHSEVKVGNITKEYVDFLKHRTITKILEAGSSRSANALCAYATFLNKLGINSDNYPMYLHLLAINHQLAIDALLDGYVPERYLDCVAPNPYIIRATFETFSRYKSNEIYEMSLRVFLGFLSKVYESPEEGYQLYAPTIADINSLGKFLNESRDQDEPLNRAILDALACFAELDRPHETDIEKKNLAAQAGRIRSDFFDHKRNLRQSITEVILEKAQKPSFGIPPEYIYR